MSGNDTKDLRNTSHNLSPVSQITMMTDKANPEKISATVTENLNVNSESPRRKSTLQSVLLVATMSSGMLLNIASATIGSITLPRIGEHFNVEEDSLQWIVSAFSLSSGCLLIFFGRLADLHGRKLAFLVGSLWLAVFSLACGFANSIIALDVLRAFQGLGPAATVPASLGILAQAFPPSRARSIAFATFSAGAPIGGAVGLQLGGILTEWAPSTWRAPFFLSAGLSFLIFLGGVFTIDKDKPSTETDRRVDWLGAALVTAALVLITFVLGQGELAPDGWRTPYIIALLIVGVFLLLLFLYWQHYLEQNQQENGKGAPPPLLKLSMWSRAEGKFAVMQIIAFLEWAAFMSWSFWAQLYYQDFENFSPVLTAIRMLPMFVVGLTCNLIVALVIGRIDVVFLIATGTLLTGIASLLFAVINPAAVYWAFGFPAAIVSVFGADFVFASGTLFVAKVSLPHEQSLAGALFQTITQLGTAFGLAITTIVHNKVLRLESSKQGIPVSASGDGAPRDAQLKAYQAAQWAAFAFALFGAILAPIFLRGVGIVGHRHPGRSATDANDDSISVSNKEKQEVSEEDREQQGMESTVEKLDSTEEYVEPETTRAPSVITEKQDEP